MTSSIASTCAVKRVDPFLRAPNRSSAAQTMLVATFCSPTSAMRRDTDPCGSRTSDDRMFVSSRYWLTDRWARAWDRRSRGRSEEHTSELQSLMRISYAVFCLKKKKNKL